MGEEIPSEGEKKEDEEMVCTKVSSFQSFYVKWPPLNLMEFKRQREEERNGL